VKIAADTNVLVRAFTEDDLPQSKIAEAELQNAEVVAIAIPALCELVWVLSRGYKISSPDIADAIRRLIGASNVVADRPAVEAGLEVLDRGGDFADGVIAYEGAFLGADAFVSFDRRAVDLVREQGREARLLE
jgi:predicted nucleic-acid-binding protein